MTSDPAVVGELPLIFIMGEHRSGTSILYNILVETGCFNPVTVYHILHADQLRVNAESGRTAIVERQVDQMLAGLNLRTRVIDNLQISAGTPEEYCFYLLRKLGTLTLQPKSAAEFIEFCRTVLSVSAPARPLLLKNPWDYTRFGYIHQQFPQARFIFIHRDPIQVLNSQVRALRQNLLDGNPYNELLIGEIAGWRAVGKRCLDALIRWAIRPGSTIGIRHLNRRGEHDRQQYIDGIERLPTSCFRSTTYEELCARPNEVVDDLLDFVGFSGARKADLADRIAPRSGQLLPEIEQCLDKLCATSRRSMQYHGYTRTDASGSPIGS